MLEIKSESTKLGAYAIVIDMLFFFAEKLQAGNIVTIQYWVNLLKQLSLNSNSTVN